MVPSPLLLCLAFLAALGCNGQQARSESPVTDGANRLTKDASPGQGGEQNVRVELVDERFEISRGLMCRRSMAPGWGMLFFMPENRVQSFWMKNTLIPLDLVFISDAWSIVGVVENAQPQTRSPRGVNTPSSYVLELNAGAARQLGLVKGTQLTLVPPEGTVPAGGDPRCRTDADCTAGWTPSLNTCASIQRCYGGQCIDPPAVTGRSNQETAALRFSHSSRDTK